MTHRREECDQAGFRLREVADLSAMSAQAAGDKTEGRQKGEGGGQVNDQAPHRTHDPRAELEQSLAQGADLGPGTGCARSSQT